MISAHARQRMIRRRMGQRLRDMRESTGMTQDDFARTLGVARSTVGRAETGQSWPSPKLIAAYESATGASWAA